MKSYRKLWIITTGMLFLPSAAQSQITLERIKVTKDISMKIPTSFALMEQADINNKYISARMPIAMYTSIDRQVDLGINENSSTWTANDLEILKDFYKANILNLFTEVQFIQQNIKDVGERSFVVYEFVSKITDDENAIGETQTISKYTYIMYTLRNNKVLIFNFTCPSKLKSQWESAAAEMMESVRIK